jgi:hypothetical protein
MQSKRRTNTEEVRRTTTFDRLRLKSYTERSVVRV